MRFVARRGVRFWVLVVVLASITISAIGAVKIALDGKSYIHSLRGTANAQQIAKSTDAVKSDAAILMSISKFPVIAQLLDVAGLNFSKVDQEVQAALDIAPSILNSKKPLRYLVAFQNSAEARGTGGILGAYAIIEFKSGQIKVIKTGSNQSLYSISLKQIPIDVPNEFLSLYGQNPAMIQNSNLSPHFPYGAEIWIGLWKERFGEDLDGVIAIDPEALSYVLRATGDIELPSGQKITSANIVEETLKNAYKKYEKDNIARKQYLVDILNAAVLKIQNGNYSKLKLAQALKESILQNRLLIYSTDKKVEDLLAVTRFGSFMTTEPNNEFRAVIQNIDAGKLDYYLDRSVTITSTTCNDVRTTQVKVRVTNTLDSGVGLPAYVLTRSDKGKPDNLVTGSHRFKLFIYGPVGSRLVTVSRENRTADLGGASSERKRPIYVTDIELGPKESEEVLANFSGGKGRITYIDQPLVRPTQIKITDKC